MNKSQEQMQRLLSIMTERDFVILELLIKTKCMYTGQIRRALFTSAKTIPAGTRAATRNLTKLKNYGLVDSFSRRVGGAHAGSSAYIWYVTEYGKKCMKYSDSENATYEKRERFIIPSMLTLRHRIAEAEFYVRMLELERNTGLVIRTLAAEPDAWRDYTYYGKKFKLKPDLFLRFKNNGYLYSYFVEVDLATEDSHTIIQKCERYHDYYHTKAEQKANGIFPLVMWLVPNEKRKRELIKAIKSQYENTIHIFYVCTFDEFEKTITTDIDNLTLI